MELVDTHTHLDDEQFADDLLDVIAAARAAGVGQMVNIGYRPARWRTTRALVERHAEIWCALGLHPGHADEGSDAVLDELERALEHARVVALGEIGLDYYWTVETKPAQWDWFERQLDLADRVHLPVVIHQRSAADDVAAVLGSARFSGPVVLHSFDGAPSLLALGLERGYYFGVGGLMTRQQAESVREALRCVPWDRMLLETDSPYLIPSGTKARRNTPATIPWIAARLADLRGVPIEEVARLTTENARRLFPRLDGGSP